MRSLTARMLACFAVILAVPAALMVFAFGLPAQYGQTYLAALGDKRDALAGGEGRRIVVAGGSGAGVGRGCGRRGGAQAGD